MKRLLNTLAISLAGLLLTLAISLLGLFGSEQGSRWLLAQVPGLSLEGFSGQLGQRWQAEQLHWTDGSHQISLQGVRLEWQAACLLRLTLCIQQLQADRLQLSIAPTEQRDDSTPLTLPTLPFPIALQLDELYVGELRINDAAPLQQLRLSGQLHSLPDWSLQAQAQLSLPMPDGPALNLNLQAEGSLQNSLRLHMSTQGYLDSQLQGHIQPLAPQLPLSLHLQQGAAFQLPALPSTLRLQGLDLKAEGDLHKGYQLSAQARLGAEQEVQLSLEALLNSQALKLAQLSLQTDPQHQLTLSGHLDWQQALQADIDLLWQDFPWQRLYPSATLPVQLQQLKAQLNYRQQRYQGQIAAHLLGPAGAFSLKTPIQGSMTDLQLPQLQLSAGQGRASGRLQLDWAKELRWLTELELQAINPSYWMAELPGSLGGTLHSEGQLQQGQPQGKAALNLSGRLRNSAAKLQLDASGQPSAWQLEKLDIQLGDNRLYGQLGWAQQLSGQLSLAARKLAQLWPGLQGQANGQVQLSGTPKAPLGTLTLQGQGIAYEQQRLRQLNLSARLTANQQGSLELNAKGLTLEGTALGDLSLSATGNPERHQASLQLTGRPLSAELTLSGSLGRNNQWTGQILAARLKAAQQDWVLQQATRLDYLSSGHLQLAAHCWRFDKASLCAENQRLLPDPQLRYQLRDFPLDSLNPWLADDLRWKGQLNAKLAVDILRAGPSGQISLDAGAGSLEVREGKQWLELPYQALSLDSRLQPKQVEAQLNFRSQALGNLAIQATLDPQKRTKPLSGSFSLQGLDLSLARPFLPAAERLEGQLNGQGRLSGNLEQPQISGQLQLKDGWVSGNQLPISLEKLRLNLDIKGEQMQISGAWQSGPKGQGSLEGHLNWAEKPRLSLQLDGQMLPVTVEPYARLNASPKLNLSLQGEQLVVSGQIRIPSGDIRIRELPASTVKVSADTVILGENSTAAPKPASALKIAMNVDVEVGQERLSFSGFGLQADLAGHLRITDNLNSRGELKLQNGRYQAYGQRLNIRRARLLFTGALTEPFLDIEAIRRIEADNVNAGLRITGSTAHPKAEVFAEPAMSQEQALSYLVMGHALGTKTGDSNLMARAALGLGLSGSASLTSALAKELGIQDFQLDTEGTGESTSVVASGKLTERLSLRYGVGIFEQGNTVALRYQLTQKLFLEAASGLSSSLDLFYRREF